MAKTNTLYDQQFTRNIKPSQYMGGTDSEIVPLDITYKGVNRNVKLPTPNYQTTSNEYKQALGTATTIPYRTSRNVEDMSTSMQQMGMQSGRANWSDMLVSNIRELRQSEDIYKIAELKNTVNENSLKLEQFRNQLPKNEILQLETEIVEASEKINELQKDMSKRDTKISQNQPDLLYQIKSVQSQEDEATGMPFSDSNYSMFDGLYNYFGYELPQDLAGTMTTLWASAAAVAPGILRGVVMKALSQSAIPAPGMRWIAAGTTVAGIGGAIAAQYKARQKESRMEAGGAYQEKLDKLKNQYFIQTGTLPEGRTLAELEIQAYKGTEQLYDANMLLFAEDIVQTALLALPWANTIRNSFGISKYGAALAGLGGLAIDSWMEGKEEGYQFIVQDDYMKDEIPENTQSLDYWWDTSTETAKAMFGIGNPEYMNDKEFRNAVRSGKAMGFLMGSPVSVYGAYDSVRKYSQDERAVKNLIDLEIDTEKANYRQNIYAKAVQNNTEKRVLNILKGLKNSEYAKENNITSEEIDHEIELAKQAFTHYKYVDSGKLSRQLDPIEKQTVVNNLINATSNISQAKDNMFQHEELINDLYSNIEDVLSEKDPNFTNLNRIKNRIVAINGKLEALDNNKDVALQQFLTPYKKYLTVELSKSIKELEEGTTNTKLKSSDLLLPIDEGIIHYESLNLDNEFQVKSNEELFSYLSKPDNVLKFVDQIRKHKDTLLKEKQNEANKAEKEAKEQSEYTRVKDTEGNKYVYAGKDDNGNYQFLNEQTKQIETFTPEEVKSKGLVEESTNKAIDKEPTLLVDKQDGEYLYLGKSGKNHRVQNLETGDISILSEKELKQAGIRDPKDTKIKDWVPGSVLNLLDQDNRDYNKFKEQINEAKEDIEQAKEEFKETKKGQIKEEVFSDNPIEDLEKFVKHYKNDRLSNLNFIELFGQSPGYNLVPVVRGDVIGILELDNNGNISFISINGTQMLIGNIEDTTPIKSKGFTVLKNFLFDFEISDNGNTLSIDGTNYIIDPKSPLKAVKEGKDEVPVSVTLTRQSDNKKITFTNKSVVSELAYSIMLLDEAKNQVLSYQMEILGGFVLLTDDKNGNQYRVYNRDGKYVVVDHQTEKQLADKNIIGKRVLDKFHTGLQKQLEQFGTILDKLNSEDKLTKNNIRDEIDRIDAGIRRATEKEINDAKSASELPNVKEEETTEIEQTDEQEELSEKHEKDLIDNKTEELAEEATESIIDGLPSNDVDNYEDRPTEVTEYENEVARAYRDAQVDGLKDVATSVAWTANDHPIFDKYISDKKLDVTKFKGEVVIDFDYNEFWDKHSGLKERIQKGEEIDLTPTNPDFFDEVLGENIVDSLPLRIIIKDENGNTLPGENLYFHNSGYNNIKVPKDVQNVAEYRINHKLHVRATRDNIINSIIKGDKVTLSNFVRFSGRPNVEPQSAKNRNKLLTKVFKNVKEFTLAVATSSGIMKRGGVVVPGFGSEGNVFYQTKETINGELYNVKLNPQKLSIQHAEILANAMIQAYTPHKGGYSRIYYGPGVENMTVGEVIEFLALEGEKYTRQDIQDNPRPELVAKQLYSKDGIIYYGENGKLDTTNYTDSDKVAFINWARNNKNYVIDQNKLDRLIRKDFTLGKFKGKKGQVYDNFLVENGIVLTDLKEDLPFHAPLLAFQIDNEILDSTETIEEKPEKKLPKGYSILDNIGNDLSPFRLRGWSPNKYKPIDLQKELGWLKERLPGLDVELIDEMINISNVLAFSYIDKFGITLYSGSEEGTIYHEAFHYVSLSMLTDEQRAKVYNEARKEYSLGDMEDSKVEEVLAEKFREYVLTENKKSYKARKPIKAFFSRLWRLLYAWATGRPEMGDLSIERLFQAINNKEYKYSTKIKDIEGKYARLQSRDRIKAATGFTTDNIREFVSNIEYLAFTLNDIETLTDINKLDFDIVLNKLTELRDTYESSINQVEQDHEELPELIRLAEVYNAVIDNYSDFVKLVEDHLQSLKIFRKEEATDNELERGSEIAGFGKDFKASYETSAKDNMLSTVKMLIMTLPESKDRSRFSNLFSFVEFDSFWNKIMYDFHNYDTMENMMNAINIKSKDVFPYTVLYNKLKDNELLKTQFYVGVKKARHKFVNILYNMQGDTNPTFYFTDADIQSARRAYISEWGTIFAESNLFDSENNLRLQPIESLINRYELILKDVGQYDIKGSIDNHNKIVEELVDMFNSLSIPIDKTTINNMIAEKDDIQSLDEGLKKFVTEDINYLFSNRSTLYTKAKTGKVVKNGKEVNNENLFRYEGQLGKIAESFAYSRPEDMTVTVLGPGGNPYYVYSQNSYVTDIIRKINNDNDKQYINELLSAKNNSNSFILNQLKNDDKLRKQFGVETVGGFIQTGIKDEGRDYLQLSYIENFLFKFAAVNSGHQIGKPKQGRLPMPTLADKKTYQFYTGIDILDYKVVVNKEGKLVYPLDSEVVDTFTGYIMDEYNRKELVIQQIEDALEKGDTSHLVENVHYKIAGDNQQAKVFEKVDRGIFKIFKDKNNKYVGNGTKFKYFDVFNNVTFDPSNTNKMRSAVISFLRDNIRDTIKYAGELGIIEVEVNENGVPKILSNILLDTDLVKKVADKEFNGNQRNAMYKLLANYTVNSMVANIETTKLFIGDPTQFKDVQDMIKRLGVLMSTGDNLRNDYPSGHEFQGKTTFTSATLNTDKLGSIYYDNLKNKYIELLIEQGYNQNDANHIAKAKLGIYKAGIDQTDAQVYVTPTMYREIAIRLGEWNDDKQTAYEALISPKELNAEEETEAMKAVMSPLKVVYFGQHITDGLGISIYDKMSAAPLFRRVVQGTKLQPLLDRMEATGDYTGMPKIDYVKFDSAVKAGKRGRFNYYADKERTKVRDFKDNDLVRETQYFEYLRRQLVTEPHDTRYTLFGTQAKKLIMGNIVMDAVYTKDGLTGRDIVNIINETLSDLSNIGKESLLEELGVKEETIDGEQVLTLDDPSKLVNMLYNDFAKSGATDNMLNALSVDEETGKPYLHFDALPERKKIENKLLSLIEKRTVDLQMPGNAFIQMTNFGINDDLKFTRYEDGEIKNMECIVSVNLFKDIIPNYDKLTFAEKRKWMQEFKPTILGYRIPTQGKSSTPVMTVVDVLPEQMGDTIILPTEFTALTGSDFDIDKLYVTRYNYYTNKEGKVKKIKYSGKRNKKALENRLLDSYITILNSEHHFIESITPLDTTTKPFKEEKEYVGIVKDIRDLENKAGKYDWQGSELSPRFQDDVKMEYTGGKDGIGPYALGNTHHVLGQQVNLALIGLMGDVGHTIRYSDLNESAQKNVVKWLTHNGRFPLTDKDYKDLQENGRYIDLSQSRDKNEYRGELLYISDWLNGLINAHVDIAKDPWIFDLNVNKHTHNLVNLLIRAGVGENTFYFLSQPILKDYIKEVRLQAGNIVSSSSNPMFSTMKKYQYQFDKLVEEGQEIEMPNIWDKERLRNDIDIKTEKNVEYYARQIQILEEFKHLNKLANFLNQAVMSSRIDTKGYGKNLLETKTFINKLDKVIEDRRVINFDKILSDTFIGTLYNNSVLLANRLFSKQTITSTKSFWFVHDYILEQLGKKYSAGEVLINNVADDLFSMISSKFFTNLDNGLGIREEDYRRLLYGDNSLAKRLQKLIIKDEFKNNRALKALKSFFDNENENVPDTVLSYNTQVKEKWDKDDITSAFEDLLTHSDPDIQKLAKDLYVYSFISSGFKRGIYSFFQYNPVTYIKDIGYNDFIIDQLNMLNSQDGVGLMISQLDDFYKHNWNNDNIVPAISIGTIKDGLKSKDGVIAIFKSLSRKGFRVGEDGNIESVDLKIGTNNHSQPIFKPFVKLSNKGKYRLYEYQGYVMENIKTVKGEIPTAVPVYTLTNKLGYYEKGVTFKEYGLDQSVFPENNEVISDKLKYNLQPENIGYVYSPYEGFIEVDKYSNINFGKEDKDLNIEDMVVYRTPKQIETEKVEINLNKVINIHAGQKENAELSNLSIRPFTYLGAEFNSVEQAFQESKLSVTEGTDLDLAIHKKIAESNNVYDIKKYGMQYPTLDIKKWNSIKDNLMKIFIKHSFEQNKDALQLLLNTGNSKLTHEGRGVSGTYWSTKFPEILMEVRNELRGIYKPKQQELQFEIKPAYLTIQDIKDRIGNITYDILTQALKEDKYLGLTNDEISKKLFDEDGVELTSEEVGMIRETIGLTSVEQQESPFLSDEEIYSKLGDKTVSKNVKIISWNELSKADIAINTIYGSPVHIISTRIYNSNEHFGNPFSSDERVLAKNPNLIKTNSTKESVKKYIEWILSDNTDIQSERHKWIREQLQSGDLQGLDIYYYKELGEPSHATALDYLINEYNWSQTETENPFLSDEEIFAKGVDVRLSTERTQEELAELREKYKHCI